VLDDLMALKEGKCIAFLRNRLPFFEILGLPFIEVPDCFSLISKPA
jgi:hypothetical protein